MSTTSHLRLLPLLTAAALGAATVAGVSAQEPGNAGPLSNVIIAGYGSALYGATLGHDLDSTPNDFSASISPVILFGMGDDLLFETELEFGVSGSNTTTTLEYAQIDYLGFEKWQFIAGKFLLPFGVFGERLHPAWINKLPTMPLLFGHAHGGVAEGALLPVLSDAGVMARFVQPVGTSSLNVSFFVTQGPSLVTEEAGDGGHAQQASIVAAAPGHDEGAVPEVSGAFHIPQAGFGVSFGDNNSNKMIGGRLGWVSAPGLELYASAFHAMYDPDSYLDYQGFAVSAVAKRWGFDLLGEAAYLRQEFDTGTNAFEFLTSPGYYVEAARRIGSFEPTVRWAQLLDAKVDGAIVRGRIDRLTVGLSYWVSATVPLKAAYLLDPEFDDRVVVQWAFGF